MHGTRQAPLRAVNTAAAALPAPAARLRLTVYSVPADANRSSAAPSSLTRYRAVTKVRPGCSIVFAVHRTDVMCGAAESTLVPR